MIQNSRIFLVDSHQRVPSTGSTDSNFQYQISIPPGEHFDRVCVLNALVPKSYYLVQTTNNTFQIVENGVSATVAVQAGNYNVKTWITFVLPLINSASPHGLTYTMTYPNTTTQIDTGKYTFGVSGADTGFCVGTHGNHRTANRFK